MPDDVRARIESAGKEFMAAFKRGDAAGIANLYTPDAQLLPPNSDFVRGTEAIGKFWQGVIDLGLQDAILETLEVEAHDQTAFEVGRYRLVAADGSVADQGKYIVVWKNHQGAWKLHRDIWSTSQPA